MHPVSRLRALLAEPRLRQAPGCYDAFTARLVERAGFPLAYAGGFGASASRLGLPDTGLLSFKEMADHVAALAAAVTIPLVADADTGYGNPMNVHRTVRAFARAGAAGVQIEDQVWPKRCGHTPGKQVVDAEEAVARIRAAVEARAEEDVVIVARTDARASEGLEAALDRCRAFAEAGADVLFVEAPESVEELARVAEALDRPLVVNLLEGGRTPLLAPEDLEAMGYRIAVYPLTLLLASAGAVQGRLADFGPWEGSPSFQDLKDVLGFSEYDRRLDRFRGSDPARDGS